MSVMRYPPNVDLFARMLEDLPSRAAGQGDRMRGLLRTPDADVVESEGEILVLVDAPGMEPGDIEISLENNVLSVRGERRPEWREAEEVRYTWHLAERRYGRFSRSFVLPRDVDADRIQARFQNGVLSIAVPKTEKARRRRIQIQSDAPSREVGAGSAG